MKAPTEPQAGPALHRQGFGAPAASAGARTQLPPSRLIRLLVFAALLIPALAAVELFVWAFKGVGEARQDAVEAPYLPVRLRENYSGAVFDHPFHTNRYGFRGEPDFPRAPEPRETRVLSLGDSIGVGLGIAAHDSYVKVAERRLAERAAGAAVRVVNAAGQGYSPSGYLAWLKHEGMRFGPRAVVVQIELCNDVTDEALLDWRREGDRLTAVRGGRYVVSWDGNLLGTVASGPRFFEKTYAYTFLLRRTLDSLFEWFPNQPFRSRPDVVYYHLYFDRWVLDEARIEEGWRRLFEALAQTRDFLAQREVPFLVLIVPPKYVFEDRAPAHRDFARSLLDRAVQMAAARDLPHLEVESELAGGGGAQLYPRDFAHLNEEGNRLIGEALASRLAEMLP